MVLDAHSRQRSVPNAFHGLIIHAEVSYLASDDNDSGQWHNRDSVPLCEFYLWTILSQDGWHPVSEF
ncbi:MAG: hypothetical protein CM1200mP3_18190 [Chloroflexota bacterium]|nr:MAG: hypothetical protein CM1200mP3_18190 [Chloroflexota bacterium]